MKKLFIYKLFLILIFLGVVTGFTAFYSANRKIQAKDNCVNVFEVKDYTTRTEPVKICDGTLFRGKIRVVGKSEFPDLFQFSLGKDKKPDDVVQYVRVFEKDKQEYVSLKSVIDYRSWNNSALGIFRKESDSYIPVFRRTFDENNGRWVNIEFGEDNSYKDTFFYLTHQGEGLTISGDLGFLGCFGGCRMLWWDFYDWNSDKKTYVLSNNKHIENFKKLLESYEELDKKTCYREININTSISNLYPLRKDKEKICGDMLSEPSTTVEQAEMLLKGIKAIKMIIDGKNISMNEVKEIELN